MVCEAPDGCHRVEDGMPPLIKGMAIVKDFEPTVKAPFSGGYPTLLFKGKRIQKMQKAEGTVTVVNADGTVVDVTLPIA
jgi:hypothetical protein